MAQTYHNYINITGSFDARRKLSAKLLDNPPANWEWEKINLENSSNDIQNESLWVFFSRNGPVDLETIAEANPDLTFKCRLLDLSSEYIYTGTFAGGKSSEDWFYGPIEWIKTERNGSTVIKTPR